LGKWHSAGNAVRHYRRTRPSSCIPIENREIRAFKDFSLNLRGAIMPADNAAGTEAVLLNAAHVWRVKRSFDRWIETRTEDDWLALAGGAAPRRRFWLRGPGLLVPDWVVTASVCLRWGRGPRRSRGPATEDHERPDRTGIRAGMHTPRMHAMVSVHSTGPQRCPENGRLVRPELAPAQADPRVGPRGELDSERTKPECYSSQSSSENMSVSGAWDPDYAAAYALAERLVERLMGKVKRTKPEYHRKETSSENMSAQDGRKVASGASEEIQSTAGSEMSGKSKQTKLIP